MSDEQGSNDDLYCYDGRRKLKPKARVEPIVVYTPQIRRPRQDSAIDFNIVAEVLHHDLVGTLFAPYEAAQSMPRVRNHSDSMSAIELSCTIPEMIADLRIWLSGFELPQAHTERTPVPASEFGGSPWSTRKRSCTTEIPLRDSSSLASSERRREPVTAATTATGIAAPNGKSPNEPTPGGQASDGTIPRANLLTAEERLVSSLVPPLSPTDETSERVETERVKDEYEAIERAREDRLRRESKSARIREVFLKMVARVWEEKKRERERDSGPWKREKHLALFDAMTR